MNHKTYQVIVYTPLGNKSGVLECDIDRDTVEGTLTLLGNTQSIRGTIATDGTCHLEGSFVTVARTVPFTATGKLCESTASLLLCGERSVFRLTGNVRRAPDLENA